MSTVVVVGSINHDRMWQVDGPLVPGARLSFTGPQLRLGGGGFTSGLMLRELGHEVILVSRLMRDAHGLAARQTLDELGFDTRHVVMLEGETPMVEILVDPQGERTILFRRGAGVPMPALRLDAHGADAAYVNAHALDAALVTDVARLPLVMLQFPLQPVEPRPADILISSRADFGGGDGPGLWQRARALATGRLSSLVLTDGPDPIHLIDHGGVRTVPPPRRLELADATGAGDYFAAAYLHELLGGHAREAAAVRASDTTARTLIRRQQPADAGPSRSSAPERQPPPLG